MGGRGDGASGAADEMADAMDAMGVDALRELSAMLRRKIDKQKVELSTLVARRDELRRERDLRRATADTLVEQINASVFVKEERRREAMRS